MCACKWAGRDCRRIGINIARIPNEHSNACEREPAISTKQSSAAVCYVFFTVCECLCVCVYVQTLYCKLKLVSLARSLARRRCHWLWITVRHVGSFSLFYILLCWYPQFSLGLRHAQQLVYFFTHLGICLAALSAVCLSLTPTAAACARVGVCYVVCRSRLLLLRRRFLFFSFYVCLCM